MYLEVLGRRTPAELSITGAGAEIVTSSYRISISCRRNGAVTFSLRYPLGVRMVRVATDMPLTLDNLCHVIDTAEKEMADFAKHTSKS